jgi:outer membrane protein assembly factor BamB
MAQSKFIYLGVRGSVVALNSANGQQIWAASLKGADFVNVAVAGSNVFATTHGEVFCLDAQSGVIRWHNPLKGYGWGLVSIAEEGLTQDSSALASEKRRRDAAASSG